MKALKENVNGIILCLFEILVGILLLINPVGFTAGIIVCAGVVLIVFGIISIVKYFREDAREAALSQALMKGLVALAAGLFCVFKSRWFVVTFPILTIIYGVVIFVAGLGKVQLTVDMLRLKSKKWFISAISAALSLVCAVVILNNPFTTTAVLWMFTGITLIIEAVFDVIALIVGRNKTAA
ncbi:MAG: HdeD family acid-resistance protein [Oscillospiraceae bacterium]